MAMTSGTCVRAACTGHTAPMSHRFRLAELRHDLLYGARLLRRSPVYAHVLQVLGQRGRIGVRTEFGAPRHMIVRLFVQDGVWLAAIGTMAGVVVASALFASAVASWRAVAGDPVAALRHQ